MFGRKPEAVDMEKAVSAYSAERSARLDAQSEWMGRRKEAMGAVELPSAPYRITKTARLSARVGEVRDAWVCEQAIAYSPDYPATYDDEKHGPRFIPNGGAYFSSMSIYDPYPVAAYRDDQPEATVVWQPIGPTRLAEPSPYDFGRDYRPRMETADFSTFAEAEKWLKARLKPVSAEVYFTPSGSRSRAKAAPLAKREGV